VTPRKDVRYPTESGMSFHTEGNNRRTRRWRLVVAALVGSDVLLALVMWLLAFVLQTRFGRIPLAVIPVVSIVPPLVLWLGWRAYFGLYSPSHWPDSPQEEFRRNAYSVLAAFGTLAILLFATQTGTEYSPVYVFAFFGGLFIAAPYGRRWVKWRLRRAGVWP
jgi:drug/metabolite transporter superfamily protein YnfA